MNWNGQREKVGKSTVFRGLSRDPAETRAACIYAKLITHLYNINHSNALSIQSIDSLNWTHDAGDLYGRTHIVANPQVADGRDI
jgi:hypothetical protein